MDNASDPALIVLALGVVVSLAMLLKAFLDRVAVPALVGYLLLGFVMRVADDAWGILPLGSTNILTFMQEVGLVTLLFRVGLESDVGRLASQLRRASLASAANVVGAGGLGYVMSRYLLALDLLPSLVVAVAFTATSVGVTVSIWQEAGALRTEGGSLLLDLAELDDVLAILLMGLLFSVLPLLKQGDAGLLDVLGATSAAFALKAAGFAIMGFAFARFMERPLSVFLGRYEQPVDKTLSVAALGFIFAGVAGLLGFSLAIGAFFAGLAFSRDPGAMNIDRSFLPVYELFSPFFFIGIGLDVDPSTLVGALGLGGVLFLGAVAGKLLGVGLPVGWMLGPRSAVLLSASMVPRAEITMIIMQKGREMGAKVVGAELYGAMMLVSVLTCIAAPPAVRSLMRRWPQKGQTSTGSKPDVR